MPHVQWAETDVERTCPLCWARTAWTAGQGGQWWDRFLSSARTARRGTFWKVGKVCACTWAFLKSTLISRGHRDISRKYFNPESWFNLLLYAACVQKWYIWHTSSTANLLCQVWQNWHFTHIFQLPCNQPQKSAAFKNIRSRQSLCVAYFSTSCAKQCRLKNKGSNY